MLLLLSHAVGLPLLFHFLFLQISFPFISRRRLLVLRRFLFNILEFRFARCNTRYATRRALAAAALMEILGRVRRLPSVLRATRFPHRFRLRRLQLATVFLLIALCRIAVSFQVWLISLSKTLCRLQQLLLHVLLLRDQLFDHI